ncbi:Uncharacterised protein [Mycobacteroides abscessus subsp. abscessus]|nr:Uncharacterised protein [Mycobacteroides abscessus subsp. abscessus]
MNDCAAMYTVIAHAIGLAQRPGARGPTATVCTRRSCGTHTAIATTANSAHIANDARQFSSSAVSIGTMTAAVTAAPPDRVIEYKPVIRPDRCAKSRLMRAGNTTLHTPIAAPRTADPRNSVATEGMRRNRIPTISNASDAKMVRSIPNRAAIRGAMGAVSPKNSTGRVVSRPAVALENPRSSRITSINGATDTTGGRRLAATNMIATAARIAAPPRNSPGLSLIECSEGVSDVDRVGDVDVRLIDARCPLPRPGNQRLQHARPARRRHLSRRPRHDGLPDGRLPPPTIRRCRRGSGASLREHPSRSR